MRPLMLDSRELFVDDTMPLGQQHLIGGDDCAPMPENPDPRRPDWSAIDYRADAGAIGCDRTRRGSRAIGQYPPPLREQYDDPAGCPERFRTGCEGRSAARARRRPATRCASRVLYLA